MAERLVRIKELHDRTESLPDGSKVKVPGILGVSRDKLWELRKRSDFPKPRRIPGTQVIGYLESEIDAWLQGLEQVAC